VPLFFPLSESAEEVRACHSFKRRAELPLDCAIFRQQLKLVAPILAIAASYYAQLFKERRPAFTIPSCNFYAHGCKN